MTIDNTISFRADGIDLILAGKKTVAIVPMIPQPEEFFFTMGDLMLTFYAKKGKRQLYTERQINSGGPFGKVADIVTPRGHNDIRLRITDVRFAIINELPAATWGKVGLSDLSEDSVCIYWDSFHGGTEYRWANNPWVWVIEFELVNREVKP